jgi:hypothetical protein
LYQIFYDDRRTLQVYLGVYPRKGDNTTNTT